MMRTMNDMTQSPILQMPQLMGPLYELLEKQCLKYTGHLSHSVRVEEAQELMRSILYVLGVYLEGQPGGRWDLTPLTCRALMDCYQEGLARVQHLVKSTTLFYRQMVQRRLHNDNGFYNDTLLKGIPGFFSLYRPDLLAHEVHITADYPLFLPHEGQEGITFISAYLSAWQAEDQLLTRLDPALLKGWLYRWAIHHGETTRLMHANLYSVALAGMICTYGADAPLRLHLPDGAKTYLQRSLKKQAALAPMLSLFRADLAHDSP